jgi:hypothetical protein
MSASHEYPPIDWEGGGYFGFPPPPPGAALPADPTEDPWLVWIIALDRAKAGDFSAVQELINVYDVTSDHVFVQSCCYLLGDAGPGECFPPIIENGGSPDADLVIWCCNALMARGRLADVPVMLDAFEAHKSYKDAVIIPAYLSDLLEEGSDLSDPKDFQSLDAYHDAVMRRYETLLDHFGTGEVLVYRGDRFGVVRFAHHLLDAVRRPHFRASYRRRFEASTGIDCTPFYDGGSLQPLVAAEIVEDFVESPVAGTFADGTRYFFGHRVPD